MALRHAAHAIITSHIPWNTSSTLLPPVLPRSQIRPPRPRLKPSLAAPTFSHSLSSPLPTEPAAYLSTSKGSHTQRAAGHQSFSSSPVCCSDRLPGTLDRFAPSHLRHPRLRREESIRHSDINTDRRRRKETLRHTHERHGRKGEEGFGDNKCTQLPSVSPLAALWIHSLIHLLISVTILLEWLCVRSALLDQLGDIVHVPTFARCYSPETLSHLKLALWPCFEFWRRALLVISVTLSAGCHLSSYAARWFTECTLTLGLISNDFNLFFYMSYLFVTG